MKGNSLLYDIAHICADENIGVTIERVRLKL